MDLGPVPPLPPAPDPFWGLEDGCIRLWRMDLRHADEADACAFETTDDTERAQAGRMRDPVQAKRWLFAHAAMRTLLARHSGLATRSVAYARGAGGKPLIIGAAPSRTPPDFSLTHSGEEAWLAVTRSGPVGLDLERIAPDLDWPPLMESICSGPESRQVMDHPPETRREAFHRLWVRKEAVLKAAGVGIGGMDPLSALEVLEGAVRVRCQGVDAAWWILDLPASNGYAAALASPVPNPRLAWHDWQSPR